MKLIDLDPKDKANLYEVSDEDAIIKISSKFRSKSREKNRSVRSEFLANDNTGFGDRISTLLGANPTDTQLKELHDLIFNRNDIKHGTQIPPTGTVQMLRGHVLVNEPDLSNVVEGTEHQIFLRPNKQIPKALKQHIKSLRSVRMHDSDLIYGGYVRCCSASNQAFACHDRYGYSDYNVCLHCKF